MRIFFCPFPLQRSFTSASPSRLPLPQVSASLQTPLASQVFIYYRRWAGRFGGFSVREAVGGVLLGEAALCRRSAIHFTAHSSQLAVAAWHAWLVECGVLCFTVGGVPGLLLFRCAAACPVSASSSATVPQAGLLLPSCTRCTAASSSFSRSTFSSFDMLKFSLDVSLSLFLSLSLSLSLSLPLSLS